MNATSKKRHPWTSLRLRFLLALGVLAGLAVGLLSRPADADRGEGSRKSPEKSAAKPGKEGPDGLTAKLRPVSPASACIKVGDVITTRPGERRRVALEDGSILHVNEGADLRYEGARKLDLRRGEAYVEVMPSPSDATFTVTTSSRTFSTPAARLAVRAHDKGAGVLVTQGRVSVSGLKDPVHAGQQIPAGSSRITAAPRVSHELDWTRDLMAAAEAPLVPAPGNAGGALIALDPNGQEVRLTLRKYHIDVHIEDGFARTTIDQTYFNNESSRLEGTFYFPLPPDASLSRLAMYVEDGKDSKLNEGGMAERQHAREVYETILHQRRDPALLEWVDGSTFKMRVFPLEGRKEKRIILSYTQRVPSLYGTLRYRFPAGHSMEIVRDWSFAARIKHAAEQRVTSPSHPDDMKIAVQGGDLVLNASANAIKPNKDVIVEILAPEDDRDRPRFSRSVHENHEYLMLRLRPEFDAEPVLQRRDWVVLVETAANRDPLLARTQIEILRHLLENAEPEDTFCLLAANTRVHLFDDKARPVNAKNIEAAVAWLEQSHLVGAFDFEKALAAAKPLLAQGKNPHLLHVGTALPALGERDDDKLLKMIGTGRYVGIGVGKRWNRSFMKLAAERTGGFFTQINPDEPIAWRSFELLATLNTPRLMQLQVQDAAGKARFLTEALALTQGEEIVALTRADAARGEKLPESVVVSGTLDGKPWKRTLKVDKPRAGADYLPRTWAKLEIDRLLAAGAEEHKEAITKLSMAMYVMSPFTSLLVLETEEDYKNFKVDRGRKDHWALYPCPDRIPTVHEPDPAWAWILEANAEGKKTVEQVMGSMHRRSSPDLIGMPDGEAGGESFAKRRVALSKALMKSFDLDAVDDYSSSTFAFWTGMYRGHGVGTAQLRAADFATPPFGGFPGRMEKKYGQIFLPRSLITADDSDSIGLGTGTMATDSGIVTGVDWRRGPVGSVVLAKNGESRPAYAQIQTAYILDFPPPSLGLALRSPERVGRVSISGGIIGGKVSYVNRLFKNVGYGREGSSKVRKRREEGFLNVLLDPDPVGSLAIQTDTKRSRMQEGLDLDALLPAAEYPRQRFAAAQAKRLPAAAAPNLLFLGPQFKPDNRIFGDLTLYAPGLHTSAADIQSALHNEAKPKHPPLIGKVDEGARRLIDRARAAGWETVTIAGDTDTPPIQVTCNGQGQFQYETTLYTGLREEVVCDGEHLCHLYPEIGLAGRRPFSRHHFAEIGDLVPWLLPAADDLTYGADVKLIADNVIALVPLTPPAPADKKDAKRATDEPAHQLHLVFDKDRLVERRLVQTPGDKVLARITYGEDGVCRRVDERGKAHDLANLARVKASAPNLTPDLSELLVMRFPLRTASHLHTFLRHAYKDKEREETYARISKALAEDLFVAHALQGSSTSTPVQIFAERFHAQGDRRLGFYVLLNAGGHHYQHKEPWQFPGIKMYLSEITEHPDSPLARYLSHHQERLGGTAGRPIGVLPGGKASLLNRLAACRDLVTAWQGAKERAALVKHGARTIGYLQDCEEPTWAWTVLDAARRSRTVDGLSPEPAEIEFRSALALAERNLTADAGFVYAAHYRYAAALHALGQSKGAPERLAATARRLFLELYEEAFAAGDVPLVDDAFKEALNAKEGAIAFQRLAREKHVFLLADRRPFAALVLAWQTYQMGERSLANELFRQTIDNCRADDRSLIRLAGLEYLWHTDQKPEAERMLADVLADSVLGKQPFTWRLAARIAERRGDPTKALAATETAMDLEYRDLPEIINLEAVREEYRGLLAQYEKILDAHALAKREASKELIAKVVRAADRWRALDPQNLKGPVKAAALLERLGAAELAWDYVTTPIGMAPGEAEPWLALAERLQEEGKLEAADKAYQAAYKNEPTNAQILWDRAQNLESMGRMDEARRIYRDIAGREWQPRFEGLREKARAMR